jgi:hypothetical protein
MSNYSGADIFARGFSRAFGVRRLVLAVGHIFFLHFFCISCTNTPWGIFWPFHNLESYPLILQILAR